MVERNYNRRVFKRDLIWLKGILLECLFFSQLLPEPYCSVSRGATSKSSGGISVDFCLELKGICELGVLTTDLRRALHCGSSRHSEFRVVFLYVQNKTALAPVCLRNAIIFFVRTSVIIHHMVTHFCYVIMQRSLVFFLVVCLCQMSLCNREALRG